MLSWIIFAIVYTFIGILICWAVDEEDCPVTLSLMWPLVIIICIPIGIERALSKNNSEKENGE